MLVIISGRPSIKSGIAWTIPFNMLSRMETPASKIAGKLSDMYVVMESMISGSFSARAGSPSSIPFPIYFRISIPASSSIGASSTKAAPISVTT